MSVCKPSAFNTQNSILFNLHRLTRTRLRYQKKAWPGCRATACLLTPYSRSRHPTTILIVISLKIGIVPIQKRTKRSKNKKCILSHLDITTFFTKDFVRAPTMNFQMARVVFKIATLKPSLNMQADDLRPSFYTPEFSLSFACFLT